MQARLVVTRGKTNVQEIQLRERTLVGRLAECDLRILSQTVSRKHCEIFQRNEKMVVRDLSSKNGTAVNGELVEERVLEPGDVLTIGPLEFTIVFQPPTEVEGEGSSAVGRPADDASDPDAILEMLQEPLEELPGLRDNEASS